MSGPLIAALLFTVALLAITAYSLMGSAPLLVLKHDSPMDSRFVQGFFDKYYLAATFAAGATCLGYAFAGRLAFATGAAALTLLAAALRRTVIPKMDSLRGQIALGDTGAVSAFRRTHVKAMLVNLAQLVVIVWSLITLSIQMR